MSVTIEVYRHGGERPGSEIREPLLGESLDAALARGRAALDAQAHPMQTTVLELTAPRLDLRLGDLIEVSDAEQGASWRGQISGIRHSLAPGDPPTTITLERPQ